MVKNNNATHNIFYLCLCAVIITLVPEAVLAASADMEGSSLPWESSIDVVVKSLTGPVAKAISLVVVVMCGLGLAFGEGGGGSKKIMSVLLGVAIAVGAASFFGGVFTTPAATLSF